MVVHVLMLEILRGDILQGLSRFVVMVNVFGDRVRVLVMSHLQRDMDFDVFLPHTEKKRVDGAWG